MQQQKGTVLSLFEMAKKNRHDLSVLFVGLTEIMHCRKENWFVRFDT